MKKDKKQKKQKKNTSSKEKKRKREEKEIEEDVEDVDVDDDRENTKVKKNDENNNNGEDDKKDTNNDDDDDDDEEEEDAIITKSTFSSLGVTDALCQAIKTVNWTYATRIQKETLPSALKGRDIIGLAETGSGKTGAFTIPMLQALLDNPQRGAVYAVILAPTRELAFQIHEVVAALGGTIGASSVCIVGGVDSASQAIALARNPHIVTATPGRLVDHLTNTKGFHLRKLKYLVMDEADRMLYGFRTRIESDIGSHS
jgi:ATP-dependent RNA helicase DDX47/RRP3